MTVSKTPTAPRSTAPTMSTALETRTLLVMAERRSSLMEPRMEHLLARVDSKFTLVTLAAMRAREINDYYNQLGEGLGKIVPPQVTSVSRKPLTISLEEIEVGKIEAVPLPDEPEPTEADVDGEGPEAAADQPAPE
jgi:DNA-directed RNA polymerase subunit omega